MYHLPKKQYLIPGEIETNERGVFFGSFDQTLIKKPSSHITYPITLMLLVQSRQDRTHVFYCPNTPPEFLAHIVLKLILGSLPSRLQLALSGRNETNTFLLK